MSADPSDALASALEASDPDAIVRAVEAVGGALRDRALRGADLDRAAKRLGACAAHADWEVRRAVALALVHLEHEAFESIIAKLEHDKHKYVSRAAAETIARRHDKVHAGLLNKQHGKLMEQWVARFAGDHGAKARDDAVRIARRYAHVLLFEIDHEMRNVLGTLDATLENLEHGLKQEPIDAAAAQKRVTRARRQTTLLTEMIRSLADVTLENTSKFHEERLVDIVELAKDQVLRGARDGDVAGDIVIAIDGAIAIDAHRHRLVQASMNLIKNALEAYEGKRGPVRVTARADDARVTIDFADDGCGMSDEQQRDAFQLFSSTKARGRGFGLTLVRQIVEVEHRGAIRLVSREGEGTTITIELPVKQKQEKER